MVGEKTMSKGVLLLLTPWSSSQMLGLSFPVPSPRGGHCLSICIATYYSDDVPIIMFLQFRLVWLWPPLWPGPGGGMPLYGRYPCGGSQWPHSTGLHLGVTGAW